MKKRGIMIAAGIVAGLAAVILLFTCVWFLLTPNRYASRFFLTLYRKDFDRCAAFILENDADIHAVYGEWGAWGKWYFYDDAYNKVYTTGDREVDASISRIVSTYLFATIDNKDGRAIFSLNRIPYSRNTGYGLQYAPNNDPLRYYYYDVFNESLGDGWYFSFFSHQLSG